MILKRNLQRSTIAMALAALPAFAFADAANNSDTSDGQVVVTGSRIPRASKEGPTSVTVITSKEIEQAGYANVFDALTQQTQNTGFTQGADYGNTFTPAANAISLRGLGPNHTLILINGRRVSDYPIAYGGSVNFVNLANIPSGIVDRIEILNAGASAIYGSDAIAGVVNIILKKQADGFDVNVKVGTTQHGGGDTQRVQVSGGADFGRLNTVFAAEVSNTEPIWASNRNFMSSSTLNGGAPTIVWGRQDLTQGKYLDASTTCGNFSSLYGGSVSPYDAGQGPYCASGKVEPSYWTVRTKNQSENAYGGLNYDLNPYATLFADLMVGLNQTQNNTRGPSWTSAATSTSYFLNQNTGDYEQWRRRFSPEELGGASAYDSVWHDSALNLSFGSRGQLGLGDWQYEAAFNISSYKSDVDVPHMLAGIDNYFLGPQLGTDSSGVPIYAPDPTRFNSPLTPSQLGGLIGRSVEHDAAWTETLSASANGSLFDLPAGPLKSAFLLEAGDQGYYNKADPRIAQGVFYNDTGTPDAEGGRKRYAAATEFHIPILAKLDASLAGRYDDYQFAGTRDDKFTYNASFEFRPTKTLLFRGNSATSFRAPDMNYIFASLTKGYYASTTDYYLCGLTKQPLSTCQYANYSPGANYTQTGNNQLKPENGRSYGLGTVWSPVKQFDISFDYWHIGISDEVTDLDPDALLRTENFCRTGVYNIQSSQCVDALRRITRNPANAVLNPNQITNIAVNPINASDEHTSGFDVTANLRWKWQDWGDFNWHVNYTKVLTHKLTQFAGDQPQDLLNSPQNPDWPDKVINSLGWSRGAWSSTVTAITYGRIPDQAEDGGFLSPSTLVNGSVGYQISKQATVMLVVNNLFDKVKTDVSGGWPYYAVGNYLPYQREGWLEFNYHFN